MNHQSPSSRQRRSWPVTIICVLFTALFAYIAIGIWFVDIRGYDASLLIYARFIITALATYAVFLFGCLALSGKYQRFKDFIIDLLTLGL